ncbi:MAG: AlbA family DNA-binding domain-containing protein [Myxococcaceae bacterium]
MSTEQLPPPGAKREDLRLDFKGAVNPGDAYELAKDVAALANCAGGVLLIGAYEGANNTLGKYAPVPEAEAVQVRDAYNLAVRDRCAPPPVIDPVLVPRDAGWLIAVNVWPFPSQAVGISTRGAGRQSENGWAFPFRSGVHTVFLRPEQLPMLMVAEQRRISVLLESIPSRNRKCIATTTAVSNGERIIRHQLNLELLEVRPMANVAVFKVSEFQQEANQKGLPSHPPVHIPLDAIHSVWSQHDGDWAMRLKGGVVAVDGTPQFNADVFSR